MQKYIKSVFILAVIISFPIGFSLLLALGKPNIKVIVILVGIMTLYWSIYFGLKKQKRYFFWISFVPIVLVWVILFLQEIRRVLFIIENSGMEKDGVGSPMAFLLGMFFELIFFIPLSFALFFGIAYLRKRNKY